MTVIEALSKFDKNEVVSIANKYDTIWIGKAMFVSNHLTYKAMHKEVKVSGTTITILN